MMYIGDDSWVKMGQPMEVKNDAEEAAEVDLRITLEKTR